MQGTILHEVGAAITFQDVKVALPIHCNILEEVGVCPSLLSIKSPHMISSGCLVVYVDLWWNLVTSCDLNLSCDAPDAL